MISVDMLELWKAISSEWVRCQVLGQDSDEQTLRGRDRQLMKSTRMAFFEVHEMRTSRQKDRQGRAGPSWDPKGSITSQNVGTVDNLRRDNRLYSARVALCPRYF